MAVQIKYETKSTLLCLFSMLCLLISSPSFAENVPPNARATVTGGWQCNYGYRRANDACAKIAVPPNARATVTGGWQCNYGYRRANDACAEIAVPPNAQATVTGGWQCNLGYKLSNQSCIEMTPAERAAQVAAIAAWRARKKAAEIEGYDFSLSDVERRCEAYVWDRKHGELECRSGMRELERKCEVYISDWPNGEIDCRSSGFRAVERNCNVTMYSDNYGELDC